MCFCCPDWGPIPTYKSGNWHIQPKHFITGIEHNGSKVSVRKVLLTMTFNCS